MARQACSVPLALCMMMVLAVGVCAASPRVLLVTGQSNHDWQTTAPLIQGALESSAGCVVDVALDPAVLTAQALQPYDVIVMHWTNYPAPERVWGDTAEEALLWFAESGRGIVFVHAAAACFPGWEPYEALKSAAWADGMTGHGAIHRFPVRFVQPVHPLVSGMEPFATTDELWHGVDIEPGAQVVAEAFSSPESGGTGRWEPVALVTEYGAGRAFTLLLGHDAAAMGAPGFQRLLARGVQWAASGVVADIGLSTPDEALAALRSFDYGDNRYPVLRLSALVQGSSDPRGLVEAMFRFLDTSAPRAAKVEVFEQLSLIATSEDLPAIERWLDDPDLGHAATAAAERIRLPGWRVSEGPASRLRPRDYLARLLSGDSATALAAARQLGMVPQPARSRALLELGRLPEAVRLRALASLIEHRLDAPLEPLHDLLRSPHPTAARAAQDLLRRLGDESYMTRSADIPEGLTNLALLATASSPDALEKDGDADGDAAAIDGDLDTYWDEADGAEEYRLVLTFDEAQVVSGLRITGWSHENYAPRDFEVLCDGEVVAQVSMAQYQSNRFALRFEPVQCITLELRITAYYGQSPAIRELEVFHVAE
jgi:type 1 glutamine amidotransferase